MTVEYVLDRTWKELAKKCGKMTMRASKITNRKEKLKVKFMT